ncbi:unnamed protein product, partial [Meganyctiphanes norvegica]
ILLLDYHITTDMNRLLVVILLAAAVAEGAKLNGGRSFGRSSGGRGRGRNLDAGPSDSYSAPPQQPQGPQGDAGYGGGVNLRGEESQFGPPGFGPDAGFGGETDPIAALEANIPGGGIPGEDYPILSSVPDTGFLCEDQEFPGYFADIADEAGCQVFHICQEDFRLDSFLCPNGTIFNQQYFVCDWWFNVDCAASEDFFGLNGEIGIGAEGGDIQRDGSASNNNYDYQAPSGDNGFAPGAGPAAPGDSYGAPAAPADSYGAPGPAGPAGDEPIEAPGQLYNTPDAGAGRSFSGRRRNGGGRNNNRGRSFRG